MFDYKVCLLLISGQFDGNDDLLVVVSMLKLLTDYLPKTLKTLTSTAMLKMF